MTLGDPFDLQRFVTAQSFVFDAALGELRAGRKRSHWMWFVFPQLRALGRSYRAKIYGLASLEEAQAYLAHPLLAPRLATSVQAVRESPAPSLHALFGSPDDLKFVSGMTLFRAADRGGDLYQAALDRWNGGVADPQALALLAAEP